MTSSLLLPSEMIISVTDPTVEGDDAVYKISIMDPNRPSVALHRVYRTYYDCKPVIKKLHALNPDPPLPLVPKTKVFGALEPSTLEERRRALEMFLNSVCSHRLLCEDVDFLKLVDYYTVASGAANSNLYQVGRRGMPVSYADEPKGTSVPYFLMDRFTWDEESNVSAGKMWLRGTPFVFQKVLPQLGAPRGMRHKTRMLVEDAKTHLLLLLTIQQIGDVVTGLESGSELLKRYKTLLGRLDPTLFCQVLSFDVAAGRAFSVTKVTRQGSLLDALYDVQDPLQAGEIKYPPAAPLKPLSLKTIRTLGRKILKILHMCHEYNISTPHLSLGNLLITESGNVVLSDMDDLLIARTRLPALFPYPLDDGAEEVEDPMKTMTSIDVLLFGTVLHQLSTGLLLDSSHLGRLLCAQGDPIDVEERDARLQELDEDESKSLARKMSRPPVMTLQGNKSMPTEILGLLFYIFHPFIAADLRVLVHHSFFAEDDPPTKSSKAAPAADDEKGPRKWKKQDVEVFHEVQRLWEEELCRRETGRKKREEDRAFLRDVKKRGVYRDPTTQRETLSPTTSTPLVVSGPPEPPSVPQSAGVAQVSTPPAPVNSAPAPPPPPKGAPPPPAPPPPPKGAPPPPAPPPPPKGAPPPPAPPPPPKGAPPPPAPPPPPKGAPPPPAPPPPPKGAPPPPAPPPPPKGAPPPPAPPPPPKGAPPPPAPPPPPKGAPPPPPKCPPPPR